MGWFRAKEAICGLGEGVWAWDDGSSVVWVAACCLPEASDVVEVEAVREDRSTVTKVEDGLGWVNRFNSGTCYGEEEPAVRDSLWGCQCPWDTC